jgi:hypothetical protein
MRRYVFRSKGVGTVFVAPRTGPGELPLKQRATPCHRKLAVSLTNLREESGLSQRALSTKLKRPPNFAHLVESGERTLSVCEFIEYVRAAGGDPAQMLRQIMA